jgi:hypothetical protein
MFRGSFPFQALTRVCAWIDKAAALWLNLRLLLVGYPSGQRGQTVNLLAYAFDGSNPSPTTIASLDLFGADFINR